MGTENTFCEKLVQKKQQNHLNYFLKDLEGLNFK